MARDASAGLQLRSSEVKRASVETDPEAWRSIDWINSGILGQSEKDQGRIICWM